jgi:hypothetical protein
MLSHCSFFLTLQRGWSSFLACELDPGFLCSKFIVLALHGQCELLRGPSYAYC